MAKEFKQFFDANYNHKLKLNSNRISLSQVSVLYFRINYFTWVFFHFSNFRIIKSF